MTRLFRCSDHIAVAVLTRWLYFLVGRGGCLAPEVVHCCRAVSLYMSDTVFAGFALSLYISSEDMSITPYSALACFR